MLRNLIQRLFLPYLQTRVIVRLNDEILTEFRRRVGATAVVTNATTEHMAGYQLGINHAVNVLAEGFTIKAS